MELRLGLCNWFLLGVFVEEKKGFVFKELFHWFLGCQTLPRGDVTFFYFLFIYLFFFMAFRFVFLKFSWLSKLHGGDVTFSMAFPFDFLRFSRLPNIKQQSNYLFLLKIILRKRTKKSFASIVDFKQKKEKNSKNESLGPWQTVQRFVQAKKKNVERES